MKQWIYGIGIAAALILTGCSSKQYFQPEDIAGAVSFDGNLPAPITDVLRDGATLADGEFISQEGLEHYKMPKNFLFIKKSEGKYLIADRCKRVEVVDASSKKIIFKKDFDMKSAVAANINGDFLALVFDDNSLGLIDIRSGEVLYSSRQKPAIANDTKIANPYFLGKLVIFPTLDGKLVVVDPERKKELRTIIVGTHENFNNVIFLNVIDDKLIAATPNRIISVTPQFTNALDLELSDVVYVKNRVYLLAKDGTITLTDPSLNVLKQRKYNFAHYTGAIYGQYLYIIERGGYIIALDKDLRASNIFEFPSKIEEYIFTAKDKVFYDDKYFTLNR
ncbi:MULTISPECIES: PQQ-binding-like beta-propeller repeat protein [unclassified Nitratiruptor]|uniref:outer membrane protein assembly factor BamB family protein n=1 Tax=unclassified Nitratiruptor TaxID=2624044 RepID=UPI00191597CC|nr:MULTISPECIES: PQQ-binding-like beta-propeller repeat protein [unclassified Nitratiruptor]BCD60106.1 hypothetical protein NitYY0810_C0871 [Nitratiruptor sp. YY08-10]BCD64405.1 hypothetical protein NitYY0814_C1250 [Nitratiruptor sp. YY08-14]